MRVSVNGSSVAVDALRGNLRHAGYVVTDEAPIYSLTINDTATPYLVVDIPDALFGRIVTHAVAELCMHGGVYVKHRQGNQDDRAVVIEIPIGRGQDVLAVERGVVRALDQTLAIAGQQARKGRLIPQIGASDPAILIKHLVGVWDDLGAQIGDEAQRLRAHLAAVLEHGETQAADRHAMLLESLSNAFMVSTHQQIAANRDDELLAALNVLIDQTRPRPWWKWRWHA